MGKFVHSLCISHVLNNDHSFETMKRDRPAKRPGNAKWELGVGENPKKAYKGWYAYLYKFQDCSCATAKVRKWNDDGIFATYRRCSYLRPRMLYPIDCRSLPCMLWFNS